MKQFFVFAAALMSVAGFVGCTKSEDVPANRDIRVEFSVASKDSFDTTRAVKSDWAVDDQILVVFKVGDTWLTEKANTKNNTLTLTYTEDGSWSATQNNWSDELKGSEGGEFFAIHYRGDISFIEGEIWIDACQFNYTGGEVLRMEGGQYSVEDGVMDLGKLTLKLRDDAVQFSVQDLAKNEDSWLLAVYYDINNIDEDNDSLCVVLATYEGCVTFSEGKMGLLDDAPHMYFVDIEGVVNDDDLSFFSHFDQEHTSDYFELTKTYFFRLYNYDNGAGYVFEYKSTPFALLTKGAYLLPPIEFEEDGVTPVDDCLWEQLW